MPNLGMERSIVQASTVTGHLSSEFSDGIDIIAVSTPTFGTG